MYVYGMFCASSPTSPVMMEIVVISKMLVSFNHLLRLMAQNEFFKIYLLLKFWGFIVGIRCIGVILFGIYSDISCVRVA